MLIKILNPDLSTKGVLNRFSSLQFTSKFFANGNFELHTTEDIIAVNDLIIFRSHNQVFGGIVMKKVYTAHNIQLLGIDLKGVMSFRYNVNTSTLRSVGQRDILREYLDLNLRPGSSGSSAGRHMGFIELIDFSRESEEETIHAYALEEGFLDEKVNSLSLKWGLGISSTFEVDQMKLVLTCSRGVSRTGIIFSERYKSSVDDTYTDDVSSAYTHAWQSDAWRVDTSSPTGILRRECATDEPVQGYVTPAVLTNNARKKFVTCQPTDKFKFGTDYFLGDFVYVPIDGTLVPEQITEVQQVYESTNTLINVTLGNPIINPLSKIIRKG